MKKFLSNLFKTPPPVSAPAAQDKLAQERDTQALRLELKAKEETIQRLKQEIERLRARQEQFSAESAGVRFEELLRTIAPPAAQLITQADLIESQGKPVQAKDVLAVAQRMLRALERQGMAVEGRVGSQEKFNPARHQPLNAALELLEDQMVTIRFVGISYQGKIISKAIVEA